MTTIRTIAVHEIVRHRFPRPPPEERDLVAMAVGKAIDGTLSEIGHQMRTGRRVGAAAIDAEAAARLDEALEENAVALAEAERVATLQRIREVARAYRQTEIAGLSRPRSRVCLINGRVGVYAQPDFWDGRARVFELKSYRAVPVPPDVALQLRLFQLAFPSFEMVLVCLDRHARPVGVTSQTIAPPTSEERADVLRSSLELGLEFGQEKVLEYIDSPFVSYTVSEVATSTAPSRDGSSP